MEAERFDQAIRVLSLAGSRRRGVAALLGGLLAAAVPGLASGMKHGARHRRRPARKHQHAHVEGKKKKRKKKKPLVQPPPVCAHLRETCHGNCCNSLACEDVAGCDAPGGPYCCGVAGTTCQADCDCCGILQCSERHGGACRNCGILQDACGTNDDCCAAGSSCGDNGCADHTVCLQNAGAPCDRSCECGADLFCSERANNTCQQCALPQEACTANTDCCLASSTCGVNGCVAEPGRICCQGVGAFCIDSCDCCADSICDDQLEQCVPLESPPGAKPNKQASGNSQARNGVSARSRWPRT
jgi:hypothetical protein